MVNYSQTARRMPWDRLPAQVRQRFAALLGTRVQHVALAGGGFTHGFAAVLRGSGRTLFAKAAPESDGFLYPAYLREAAVLSVLPQGLPVPRLVAAETLDADSADSSTQELQRWQLLCFEAVEGYMPGAPWTEPDLAAVHEGLISVQAGLAQLPPELTGGSMAAAFSEDRDINRLFAGLALTGASPSFIPELNVTQLYELQGLVEASADALAGNAVLHNDLRADNVIIRAADSKALFCDWNFLSTGPEWADWVGLLLYVRPDGVDADTWLHRSPLSTGVDEERIDSWLAVLAAYMIHHGSKPDVPTSPLLRTHGRFTASLVIDWLIERRRWRS